MANLINVTLRIVGVYFNKQIQIDPAVITTVKGVMETYRLANSDISKPDGFHYDFTPAGMPPHKSIESLREVLFNFSGKYDFGNGITSNGSTLGGALRKPGLLRLQEQNMAATPEGIPVSAVWQYYVVEEDGKVRSKTHPGTGFEGYNKSPNQYQYFENNDTIIWRLVVLTFPERLPIVQDL